MGRAKQYCLFLSVLVTYVCLKREKNLTLKTCAPDFSARSMTKLYATIKGARAISLFDFPKTWQVWYILPNDGQSLKVLMRILDKLNSESLPIVIIGDFNAHHPYWFDSIFKCKQTWE